MITKHASNSESAQDARGELSDASSADMEVAKNRLHEAKRRLRSTPLNQALWQIEALLSERGTSVRYPSHLIESLRKLVDQLETSLEVARLRELQEARNQLEKAS